MKVKNKKKSMNCSNGISTELLEKVIFDLANGCSPQSTANRYNIEVGNVYLIKKRYKGEIAAKKAEIDQQHSAEPAPAANRVIVNTDDKPAVTPSTKIRRKIPDEVVSQIESDLKENCLPQAGIAEMYGISQSAVSRIKRRMEGRLQIVVNGDAENEPSGSVVNTEDLIILPIGSEKLGDGTNISALHSGGMYTNLLNRRIPVLKYLRIGMVDGRHDLPVTKFFFQTMDEELMFDYERQYEMAKQVILDNIPFSEDGTPQAGIFCYVTGLSSALTSIINACRDLGVSLTLMHFNFQLNVYKPQVVSQGNTNVCPVELCNIRYRSMYTFGCNIADVVKNGGYEIIEAFYDADNKIFCRDFTFVTSKVSAWNIYAAITEQAGRDENIYFNTVEFIDGRYTRGVNIAKTVQVN